MNGMVFDYFYEEQSESYSFYRIPKLLFTEEMFESLSVEARVLYGLVLDRISLSRENGWIDEAGHVYVFYTINSVKRALRCGNTKACRLLKELDEFGLIERIKQGNCKPTIIYVKDFSRFPKREFKDSQNENSGHSQMGIQDNRKWESNKTENNKTEGIKTNPILCRMDPDEDEKVRISYLEYLNEKLDMDVLYERYPFEGELLDAIMNLILDIVCSKRKTIRIAGDDKPVNVVKSQFLKLNSMHIEYVIDCMKLNSTKVRNIKQYLLAALYNAPITMGSYYQAMVNHDMADTVINGGKNEKNRS